MKLVVLCQVIEAKKSPPARGRGLKLVWFSLLLLALGRPPRGGVD